MDIIDALSTIKKYFYRIMLTVILAMLTSFMISYLFLSPVYQASTKILINPPVNRGIEYYDVLATQKLMNTYAEILRSEHIIKIVIEQLNLDISPDTLISQISVSNQEDSQVLHVAITGASADYVKVVMKELADVFVAEIDNVITVENAYVLDPIDLDAKLSPIKPKPFFNMIVAGVASGAAAIGLALLIRFFDPTVTSLSMARRIMGSFVFGPIPNSAMITRENVIKEQSELSITNEKISYNRYMDTLRKMYSLLLAMNSQRKSFLVASPHRSMATQKIAYDLSKVVAETGEKTLLIFFNGSNVASILQQNLNKEIASTSEMKEIDKEFMFNELMKKKIAKSKIEEIYLNFFYHTSNENLDFLALSDIVIGKEKLYNHHSFRKLMKDLSEEYSKIIIASSISMEEVNHSLFLSLFVDAVCILIEKERTPKDAIQEVVYQLKELSNQKIYGLFFEKRKNNEMINLRAVRKKVFKKSSSKED